MEFIETAQENPYFFNAPKVIFEFAHKIDDDLAEELEEIGVILSQNVSSKIVPEVPHIPTHLDLHIANNKAQDLNDFDAIQKVSTLNLDVTTLLAYVSAMTNGSSNWEYQEQILTEQASCERKNPVKKVLNTIFKGSFICKLMLFNYSNYGFSFIDKRLICCETAAKSFSEITAMLGGVQEKLRATEFMKTIEILPDVDTPEELTRLNISSKIRPRSLTIFSFGIFHKALTVTANEGFIRSAKMQVI